MAGKNYGVYRRRPDYLSHARRRKPITITGVIRTSVLRLPGAVYFNRAVFRVSHGVSKRQLLPTGITPAVPTAPLLKPHGMIGQQEVKPEFDYFRKVRRLKPITITAPIRTAVLKSTSEVFRNRAVFRREYDYWLRLVKRIKPITITAPLLAIPDYKLVVNPITSQLTRVVNNLSVLKADVDETDPTGGGGAALGRIPIVVNGVTVYIPYY